MSQQLKEHLYELKKMIESRDELQAKIFANGDAIEGADTCDDVYTSDMLHAVEQDIDDKVKLLIKDFNYNVFTVVEEYNK